MTTLFNIGDKIEFTATGIVKSFSVDNTGDSYVISMENKNGKEITRIYVDSQGLLASNAKKVG